MSRSKVSGWREAMRKVIFDADTPAGFWFDVILLVLILISILVVMLETIPGVKLEYRNVLIALEWFFTGIFTIEYVLRIICLRRPDRYIRSFWGIIDLVSILPTYLALFFPGASSLMIIRGFRLMRVFRILQLKFFVNELAILVAAIKSSHAKLTVFLTGILMVVICMGTLMYWVEGAEGGFTSIPKGVYWAIVTLTTVGYGDVVPKSGFGQLLSSIIMILGYGIIAVPSGLVTAEIVKHRSDSRQTSNASCHNCTAIGHLVDARFCRQCGSALHGESES